MATGTKNARTVVSSTSRSGGSAATRGTLSLQTALGGILTMKITNGATGPTLQCEGRVLIAHNASTPSAGAAGTDWKTVFRFGGGTVNSAVTEQSWEIPAAVMALEVEFEGNTAQSVTVEAFVSELTSVG